MKKFNIRAVTRTLAVSITFGFVGPGALFAASPTAVNLGTASNFVILAKTGISTTGNTSIVGDIGISPAEATYMTGFSFILASASAFSTSPQVTGKIYAPGYANPTPAYLTTAVLDMQTAYTDASGRASSVTELGAGNIGGLTLAPGVYKWGTGVTIPTDVTLSGGANDVWIFQVAQNLTVSSATKVLLSGGAQASNIFWVVAGQTTIGTTAVFNGNILDQTTIVLNTGATLNGRALAQAAVTLDSNIIIAETSLVSVPTPTLTPSSSPASTLSNSSYGSGANNVASAVPATEEEKKAVLQIQLNGLLTTAQALQMQVKEKGSPNTNAYSNANMNASFKRNLVIGANGDDVRILQVWLNTHGYAVASTGPGSSGNETTTFGGLTRKALAKFQAEAGISPALGNFGTLTRSYLMTHYQ